MIGLERLEKLKSEILNDVFIQQVATYTDYDVTELREYIITSFEEASLSLKLLQNTNLKNKTVLEFGSGIGLASLALHYDGIQITSFEPSGRGFEKNYIVNQFILTHFGVTLDLMSDVNELKNDSFDIIFSNNVLEHIDELDKTFVSLNTILKKEGVMIHNIPNYIIPYEPHFGIPFFPLFPKKMSFMIPNSITNTNLWKSINFVNYFDIVKYAKNNCSKARFRKGLLYQSLVRLEHDEVFAKRHERIQKIVSVLRSLKLLGIFRFIPSFLSTPMIFEWRKK